MQTFIIVMYFDLLIFLFQMIHYKKEHQLVSHINILLFIEYSFMEKLFIFIPAPLWIVFFTASFSRMFKGLIVSINAEGVQYVMGQSCGLLRQIGL
jgi:hypothetical protein